MSVAISIPGGIVLVDDDMQWLVHNHTWFVSEGRVKGYPTDSYTLERLHHYITGFPIKGLEVDHINRDPLDNRRVNLYIVSHRENVLRWAQSTKGYYWDGRRQKWCVSLTINYKRVNGGRFDKESDAAKRAQELRERLNAG